MNQKPSIDYPLQFAILLGLLGLFLVLSAFLVPMAGSFLLHVPFLQVLPAMNRPENANAARILNTLASLLAFLFPALILAKMLSKRPFAHLGFHSAISNKQLLLIIVITFASMVLSGALGELNERIPIPAKWFAKAKALEDAYKAAMLSMAYMKTTGDYILALLVLAADQPYLKKYCSAVGFNKYLLAGQKTNGPVSSSPVFYSVPSIFHILDFYQGQHWAWFWD